MAKKPMLKLGALAAVGAVAVGSLIAATPSQAAAPKQPPVTAGSTYLALGDSIAFGYRETDSTHFPKAGYTKASNFVGYPEFVAKNLHLKLTNAACPGETTSAMIDVTRQDNGCQTDYKGNPGYRAAYPLHANYGSSTTSQLQFADKFLKAHPKTKLVTLQLGANDGFVCQEKRADHCTSPSELTAVGTKIARNIHNIVHNLRNKAHYTGQLIVVNYYSLDQASQQANFQSQAINSAVFTGVQGFHVRIADAYKLYQNAVKNAPKGDTDPTCSAGLLTKLLTPNPQTGNCGVHPSQAGQALIASAVERKIHNA